MAKSLTPLQRANIYGLFGKSIASGIKIGNSIRDAKIKIPNPKR